MDSLPTVVPVTPKPGLAKAIGSFNITIGFFLFLLGLGSLDLIGPSFTQNEPFKLERGDAQHLYDRFHERQLVELQIRERSTADPKQQESLRAERLELIANHQKDVDLHLDLKSINHVLLLINWYFWADLATGPVLNLLMLASGVGLTQLRAWARRMAIWVALLKIVRIVALTLIFTLVIVPQAGRVLDAVVRTEVGKLIIAKANASLVQASKNPPAMRYTPENFSMLMSAVAYLAAVMSMTFSLIYPAITLVVLTRPGAKAACCLDEISGSEEREEEWS